jgi:hypothetical protein
MTLARRAWGLRIGSGPLIVTVYRNGFWYWWPDRVPGSIPYAGFGPEFAVDLTTLREESNESDHRTELGA